jgi:chromosome segregation ATPase
MKENVQLLQEINNLKMEKKQMRDDMERARLKKREMEGKNKEFNKRKKRLNDSLALNREKIQELDRDITGCHEFIEKLKQRPLPSEQQY